VRKQSESPIARLKRAGVRVHAGPWTLCAAPASPGGRQLIVALGRAAGDAVTRSRIRRIARQVLRAEPPAPSAAELLLLARGDVGGEPRKRVRANLARLHARALEALGRRTGGASSRG